MGILAGGNDGNTLAIARSETLATPLPRTLWLWRHCADNEFLNNGILGCEAAGRGIETPSIVVQIIRCSRTEGVSESCKLDFVVLTSPRALHCRPLCGGRGAFISCQYRQRPCKG